MGIQLDSNTNQETKNMKKARPKTEDVMTLSDTIDASPPRASLAQTRDSLITWLKIMLPRMQDDHLIQANVRIRGVRGDVIWRHANTTPMKSGQIPDMAAEIVECTRMWVAVDRLHNTFFVDVMTKGSGEVATLFAINPTA